ncbi:MAG: NAD-dependent succinate-semialdehyde dehydrogenase [Candidatus Eremiobacteraeota bacterium]|nr:NAD-dependent succinate-semialdehyde dehydrogenase [Candidatus Eremiobacteraeota bacterium]
MSFQTIDPTTGRELERFDVHTQSEIGAKLDEARSAFKLWRRSDFSTRSAVLSQIAIVLRREREALARVATLEMGKPVTQARAEIEKCAWCCDHYAKHGAGYLSEQTVASSATRSFVAFRPLGVILAIMPWNFPYWQVFRFAAPALMAGNAAVLKHASNVSRCALEIERIFKVAGTPENLFNTLLISGENAGALIDDRRIAAATLTGSEGAGMSVAAAAGKALKKTVLELGGSDPFIVFDDANLQAAAEAGVKSRFQNAGQSCIAAKRFIVQDQVYERFLREFTSGVLRLSVGNPLDDITEVGPLARDDLRDALARQVEGSLDAGARLIAGGKAISGPGFFYQPTILADVTVEMPAFSEETFGPVAAVIRARDRQHAIDLANASSFGLGATLWTQDLKEAAMLAGQIESGSVFVNGMVASDPRLPFGGVKRSGYGRELSAFGIREFVNTQTVWMGPERSADDQAVPTE